MNLHLFFFLTPHAIYHHCEFNFRLDTGKIWF